MYVEVLQVKFSPAVLTTSYTEDYYHTQSFYYIYIIIVNIINIYMCIDLVELFTRTSTIKCAVKHQLTARLFVWNAKY